MKQKTFIILLCILVLVSGTYAYYGRGYYGQGLYGRPLVFPSLDYSTLSPFFPNCTFYQIYYEKCFYQEGTFCYEGCRFNEFCNKENICEKKIKTVVQEEKVSFWDKFNPWKMIKSFFPKGSESNTHWWDRVDWKAVGYIILAVLIIIALFMFWIYRMIFRWTIRIIVWGAIFLLITFVVAYLYYLYRSFLI